ncbi:universal stress protein [Mycolicibacterium frederiksbergense]|nr:universal stress protein [Mycolicibacterium frederiksbergense]
MSEKHVPPIVACVDGSQAALNAAQWAADEAVRRSVPLRLVYATKATHPSTDDYYADVHRGKKALATAKTAVGSAHTRVTVETAMVDGPVGQALIDESGHATMICVGSVGIGRYAQSILGSTATELAQKAECPTAIIRMHDDVAPGDIHWIIFAMKDPCDEAVIDNAMAEAALRHAPVLVLGEQRSGDTFDIQIAELKRRHPDVHLYPVINGDDIANFLKRHDEPVQLAVIGSSDTDQLPQILGPYGQHKFHLFNPAATSVLVVRS